MKKNVKVYSTPDCAKCNQAKKLLKEQGVQFDSVDITESSEALQEMRTLSRGARSVPIISVCDRVLVGYDRAELLEAISCLSK